jgi:hypothetical protein
MKAFCDASCGDQHFNGCTHDDTSTAKLAKARCCFEGDFLAAHRELNQSGEVTVFDAAQRPSSREGWSEQLTLNCLSKRSP